MARYDLFAACLLVAGCSCSPNEEEPAVQQPKKAAIPPEKQIAVLDQHIRPGAWTPLKPQKNRALYRRLGEKRFADANELAMWAGRNALQDMCREVKSIKVGPDANRDQLSWAIQCDGTLGVNISEKGALQTRHAVDPRFLDKGDKLPNMYSRTETGQEPDVEKLAATIINLNRHLCASVVSISPLEVRDGMYDVTCIEYRGGTGTVRYLLDAPAGIASPL